MIVDTDDQQSPERVQSAHPEREYDLPRRASGDPEARARRAMDAIGVEFRDPSLLRLALVHRSYLNEQGIDSQTIIEESNERLEFLGDSLLGMLSAEYVYRKFPRQSEGVLTTNRVALVRTETLAAWALSFGLQDLIYVSRGELGSDGELRPRALAGTFEAVLGAIYLDRGMRVAKQFMARLFEADAAQMINEGETTNYKGRLQELIQERERVTPGYRTVSVSGPAHDRVFVVEAVLRGQALGSGSGANKRTAEQDAARDALERLALEGIVDTDGRPV